jgi:hypothetical protein
VTQVKEGEEPGKIQIVDCVFAFKNGDLIKLLKKRG